MARRPKLGLDSGHVTFLAHATSSRFHPRGSTQKSARVADDLVLLHLEEVERSAVASSRADRTPA